MGMKTKNAVLSSPSPRELLVAVSNVVDLAKIFFFIKEMSIFRRFQIPRYDCLLWCQMYLGIVSKI